MAFSDTSPLRLSDPSAAAAKGHPWARLAELAPTAHADAESLDLIGPEGAVLGSGIFDRRDPRAAWRRFSRSEGAVLDDDYLAKAIGDALARRGEESCQRLISSDADYLPGLVVEMFEDVLAVTTENVAMDARLDTILELLGDLCGPREIVLRQQDPVRAACGLDTYLRTLSGNNLKGMWVEVDEVAYRIDLLRPEKAGIFLDQREQHSLLGSLCEGRCVLDAFAHSGAFALQAMKAGAEHAVALDTSEDYVKGIGANAQRNSCFVEAIQADAATFLAERNPGELDCIVLDPPELLDGSFKDLRPLQAAAFRCLSPGGLLATYCRSSAVGPQQFERIVSEAAGAVGREGRIFARTSQPFDFPTLLNFPESNYLKGLILQVE